MPVLLKSPSGPPSAEYESLIVPGFLKASNQCPGRETKEGVQEILHTFFCFVSFRYSNDIALSKQRADNPSSSHSPSHVHV